MSVQHDAGILTRSVGSENLEQRGWGSVQLIGYNRQSGATCFFEAADGRSSLPEDHPANSGIQDQRPWVSFDGHRMVGQMPGPDDPDFNSFMPPHNPGSMADDYQELVDCWLAGPENTPGCDWVVPSAQGREGGVVGDDYPHKSDYFNFTAATAGRRSTP